MSYDCIRAPLEEVGVGVRVEYLLDLTFKISKQPLVEPAALLILAF